MFLWMLIAFYVLVLLFVFSSTCVVVLVVLNLLRMWILKLMSLMLRICGKRLLIALCRVWLSVLIGLLFLVVWM